MSLSLSEGLEQEVPSSVKESVAFLFFMMLALKEQITRAKDHSKRKKKAPDELGIDPILFDSCLRK